LPFWQPAVPALHEPPTFGDPELDPLDEEPLEDEPLDDEPLEEEPLDDEPPLVDPLPEVPDVLPAGVWLTTVTVVFAEFEPIRRPTASPTRMITSASARVVPIDIGQPLPPAAFVAFAAVTGVGVDADQAPGKFDLPRRVPHSTQ
jgi:hypothetical protein